MTQVAPIKRPFNCGGGYQDQRFTATIPLDFPGCSKPEENCVLQLYAHSVEPRAYAIGIDFVLSGQPTETNNSTSPTILKRQGTQNPTQNSMPSTKDISKTQFQLPIHYNDAFDSSHVDSSYSFYRGQQKDFIRDNVLAACQLQSFVGEGGLVPLGNIDKDKAKNMRDKIQGAIKEAEKKAIDANKAAQASLDNSNQGGPKRCFEGELYGVVNNKDCNRQYTNTYVTNVDYRAIYVKFLPELQSSRLTPYSPRLKDTPGITPVDPYGSFKVNGKPSAVSKDKNQQDAPQLLAPPPKGQQFPQPVLGQFKPAEPINPPLEADFYTGPQDKGATGRGKEGAPGQKAPLNGQSLKTENQPYVVATKSATPTLVSYPVFMVPGYLPVVSPLKSMPTRVSSKCRIRNSQTVPTATIPRNYPGSQDAVNQRKPATANQIYRTAVTATLSAKKTSKPATAMFQSFATPSVYPNDLPSNAFPTPTPGESNLFYNSDLPNSLSAVSVLAVFLFN